MVDVGMRRKPRVFLKKYFRVGSFSVFAVNVLWCKKEKMGAWGLHKSLVINKNTGH